MMAMSHSLRVQPGQASPDTALMKTVGQVSPASTTDTTPAGTPRNHEDRHVALALHNLVEIHREIAHVEKMTADMQDAVPDDQEARKWYDISFGALQFSRTMLDQKQVKCLADLAVLTGSDEPMSSTWIKVPNAFTEPTAEASPAGSHLSDNTSSWPGWSSQNVQAVEEFVPAQRVPAQVVPVVPRGAGALALDLEVLRNYDNDCVLNVRKIKKLGLESPALLRQHFARYGEVADVRVTHSQVKPTAQRPNGRLRPAALGFVVMRSSDGARNALKAGKEHMVDGMVPIQVSEFVPFDSQADDCCE